MTTPGSTADDSFVGPDVPNSRQLVRNRIGQLILLLLGYFVLSSLVLMGMGAVTANVVRLFFYSLVLGWLTATLPRVDRRGPYPNPQFDVTGVWPEDWSSRLGVRSSLISGLALGGVIAWFLLEAVLLGSESWRTAGTSGSVELMLGLDVTVAWASILLAFWLWWEPFIHRDATLTLSPEGISLIGYPELQVPERIPWGHIRKVRVDRAASPMLFLWYQPLRKVFGVQLPQLSATERSQLEELLEVLVNTEPPRVETLEPAEGPRRFDRLLEQLGERHRQGLQRRSEPNSDSEPSDSTDTA